MLRIMILILVLMASNVKPRCTALYICGITENGFAIWCRQPCSEEK